MSRLSKTTFPFGGNRKPVGLLGIYVQPMPSLNIHNTYYKRPEERSSFHSVNVRRCGFIETE